MISSQAYGEAYEKDSIFTKRFLVSKGARSEEVDDIVQEAWTKGWKSIQGFDGRSSLITWVNVIALNELRNCARHKACRPIEEELDFEPISRNLFPLDKIDLSIQLQVCNTDEKKLLHKVVQGFSQEEIAGMLGITEVAAKLRLRRLYRKLLGRLERRTRIRVCRTALKKNQEAATEASFFCPGLLFQGRYCILHVFALGRFLV